jgi:hypothetical protein
MGMPTGKGTKADRARLLIAGIAKHFANAPSMAFGSATLTPAQLTTSLQALVDLRAGVEGAKATATAKVAAEKAQAPALIALMGEFVAFVKATFSNSPDVLADFGLQPKKARAPLTVEQKAAAAAKRKATRAARHTQGPKAKLAVKGNVTGVNVTPVTTPDPQGPSNVAQPPQGGGGGVATPHNA